MAPVGEPWYLDALPASPETYRGMVGASSASRQLFAALRQLERSEVNVLVEGAAGTGKKMVAAALHEGSARGHRPFIVVNLSRGDVEEARRILFGHARGAFPGAMEDLPGAFEAADGSTLFLDGVGGLPSEVQPALLRAVESGEVSRAGEVQTRKVDVRVVSAWSGSLQAQVAAGRFEEGLRMALAVVTLSLPRLEERPDDIAVLANHFARQAGLAELPDHLLQRFAGQAWPGEVRQLRQAVQTYVALGGLPTEREDNEAALDHLLREVVELDRPLSEQKAAMADRFVRAYLEVVLERAAGNRSEAARLAGMDRSNFGKLLARHGFGRRTIPPT